MRKLLSSVAFCFGVTMMLTITPAGAQTAADFSSPNAGSVIPGYDSRTCDGTIEGAVRYNSGASEIEFCNGSAWTVPASGGGCTAPTSCPNVGDVCSDGSLFAGFMLYNNSSCEPLYVTDNNQSAAIQWATATGTNDITDPADKQDSVDGQYNRDNRGGGTFPAFELCENNTYHGKNDWYLPARAELKLLWLNQAAIDANAAGNFSTNEYWASSERAGGGNISAWYMLFSDGRQTYNIKTANYDVRCVRRD